MGRAGELHIFSFDASTATHNVFRWKHLLPKKTLVAAMSVVERHDALRKILMFDDFEHRSTWQPRNNIAITFGFNVTKHFM